MLGQPREHRGRLREVLAGERDPLDEGGDVVHRVSHAVAAALGERVHRGQVREEGCERDAAHHVRRVPALERFPAGHLEDRLGRLEVVGALVAEEGDDVAMQERRE